LAVLVQFHDLLITKYRKRTFAGDNQLLSVAVGTAALPDIRLQGPLGYSSNQMNVWKREFDDHQISPE
jgi:hypothetical protein